MKSETKNWVTEGAILFFIPAMGYLLSLSFENGIAKIFGIPYELIIPSFNNILSILSFTGLLYLFLGLTIILPNPAKFDEKPSYKKYFNPLNILSIFVVILTLLLQKEWKSIFIIGSVIIFFVIFDLLWPLLVIRGSKTFEEKVKEAEKSEAKTLLNTYLVFLFQKTGYNFIPLIFDFFLIYFVAGWLGQMYALNQTTFSTISNMKDNVILRRYGDNLISADFDRINKLIKNNYRVIKIDNLELKIEKIGPLKAENQIEILKY